MRRPPAGFDRVAAQLDEYEAQMRSAIQDESTGVVAPTRRPPRTAAATAATTNKRARSDSPVHREHVDDDDDDADKTTVHGATSDTNKHDNDDTKEHNDEDTKERDDGAAAVPPLWRVAQISRARTRYVYDAHYRTHDISKAVYDYCVDMQFIDGALARRWRLPGYEHLCCNACAVPGVASVAAAQTMRYALRNTAERKQPHNNSSSNKQRPTSSSTATCICRVPAAQRRDKSFVACAVCGCRGCCSADVRTPSS